MSVSFIFLLFVGYILVTFVNGHQRCKSKRKCCECDCCEAQTQRTTQSTIQSKTPFFPSNVSHKRRPPVALARGQKIPIY